MISVSLLQKVGKRDRGGCAMSTFRMKTTRPAPQSSPLQASSQRTSNGPSTNHEFRPDASSKAEEVQTGPRFHFSLPRLSATAPRIQRKPAVASPGDAFEREADEVADKVIRMGERPAIGPSPVAIRRKSGEREEEQDAQNPGGSGSSGRARLGPGARRCRGRRVPSSSHASGTTSAACEFMRIQRRRRWPAPSTPERTP
jgi:hypothetical protein